MEHQRFLNSHFPQSCSLKTLTSENEISSWFCFLNEVSLEETLPAGNTLGLFDRASTQCVMLMLQRTANHEQMAVFKVSCLIIFQH